MLRKYGWAGHCFQFHLNWKVLIEFHFNGVFVFIIRSQDSSQSKIETEKISDLRRAIPQVCIAGVENLILLGKHENIKCVSIFKCNLWFIGTIMKCGCLLIFDIQNCGISAQQPFAKNKYNNIKWRIAFKMKPFVYYIILIPVNVSNLSELTWELLERIMETMIPLENNRKY